MNLKKSIFVMAAALVMSLMLLLPAAPAFADNPILPLDNNGNVVLPPFTVPQTTTTTPPAPPPPPPAAPDTGVTTPPTTGPSFAGPTPESADHRRPGGRHRPNPPYYGYNNWSYPWVGTYYYYPYYYYQQPQPIYYSPVVSSFTVNPSYIQQGQLATLSWNVSNADLVSISPSVGSVGTTGSFSVIPPYTTTYTLTATNSYGSVSSTTTVTVASYVPTYGINYGTGGTYGTTGTTLPPLAGAATYSAGIDSTPVITSDISSATPALNPWLMYLLLIGLLAAAAVVIIALLVRKPAAARAVAASGTRSAYVASATAPAGTLPATSSPVTSPVEAGLPAKFVSAGGTTMPVTGRPLGRRDFQALIPPEKADLISRQHILVTFENSQYHIEDLNSTNGTRVNGSEIRGTGKHTIEAGDTIQLAGALDLTFKV